MVISVLPGVRLLIEGGFLIYWYLGAIPPVVYCRDRLVRTAFRIYNRDIVVEKTNPRMSSVMFGQVDLAETETKT